MIIALVVLMLLSTLALAGLARTLSVMTLVRHGQDYDAALVVADAGLADAVYRLEHGEGGATFTGTGSSGLGTYRYRAERVSANEFRVYVAGVVGDSEHGVRALVTRDPEFKWALFADESLTIDGGGLNLMVDSWLSLGPPPADDTALVGTNGRLVCRGGNPGSAQYARAGFVDGCPNPQELTEPEPLPPVIAPAGPTQPCPVNILGQSVFTGVVNGQGGVPFVCERDVAISGTLTVINPPFVLYVLPDSSGTQHSLDLRTAVVNAGASATNVVIRKAGGAPVHLDMTALGGIAPNITFSGVLYAPESKLRIQGSKWWTGSIVARSVEVEGNPVLTIGYDLDLMTRLTDDWAVSRYAEVPASSLPL